MDTTSRFFVPLPEFVVIEATGADAMAFLHGQLTQDIEGLPDGQARPAGYCTAKGRLLATMVIWKETRDEAPVVRALVRHDLAEALVKRLTMFVLRAKVTLRITDLAVYGYAPDGPPMQTQAAMPGAADVPAHAAAWTVVQRPDVTWVAAPSAQNAPVRWWLIPVSPTDGQATGGARPPAKHGEADTAGDAGHDDMPSAAIRARQAWQAADIAVGLPWVQAATQDMFIPQTLNLDLIHGISFTKGCYPGQEVVARAHYRGAVKRRMAFGVLPAPHGLDVAGLPGIDTFNAASPGNPCGRVINAALSGESLYVLMEAQLADLGQADFRLGAPDGPAVLEQPLPYALAVS